MSSKPNLTPETTVQARRLVMQRGGLVALATGFAAVGMAPSRASAQKAADSSGDVAVMQVALALEHEGIAAYRLAGGSGLLTPGTLKVALVFKGHHEQHRDSLAALITKAGGKPVEPKADPDYVKELDLGSLKTEGDVVKLATKLEQGAANAYTGQVAALQDHKLAHLFTQLATDESVHWAVLNGALGQPVPAHAYLFG